MAFGWRIGSDGHLVQERLRAQQVASTRHRSAKCIGITIFGLTWATTSAASAGVRVEVAARRDQQDVDRPELGELLLGQEMAEVTEVADVARRRPRPRRPCSRPRSAPRAPS